MRNIIVAYDRERAIGANGDLLWKPGEMKADMKHFREITMGHAMIMGRKTLDSIGIALPGRTTIVCSRGDSCNVPGVEIAHSLEEAFELTKGFDETFVVGGGEIYRQAIGDVERIYATEINAVIPGADTYFPKLDDNWKQIDIEKFDADDQNIFPYKFVTYER